MKHSRELAAQEASTDHFVAANEYGFYCIPRSYLSREMPRLLARGDVYEPATLRFLRRQIKGGDVITGGAFVGDFFPALHECLAPGAQIHSFEPTPTSFAAACETIRLNDLDRVNLHPVAVGAENGVVKLLTQRPNGDPIAAGERVVDADDKAAERAVDVKLTTIDKIVPPSRKVDILHLDIEGLEKPALYGAARIIADNTPLIMLEAGAAWKRRSFLETLGEIAPEVQYQNCGVMENNAVFRAL